MRKNKNNKVIAFLIVAIFLTATRAQAKLLTASWYSVDSLKKEGTWETSKGVMANGEKFSDDNFTCATCLYPLGTLLQVKTLGGKKKVVVKVTDRIGGRFAKTRIDLSKAAFVKIADLEQGLVPVHIERLR